MANKGAHAWFGGWVAAVVVSVAQAAPFAYVPRAGGVSVIDLENEAIVADIPLPGTPAGIAARSGERFVYVSNGSDRIWVIDSVPQKVVATIELPATPDLTIHPKSARAHARTGCSGSECLLPGVWNFVSVVTSSAVASPRIEQLPAEISRIAFSPSANRVIYTGMNRVLSRRLDIAPGMTDEIWTTVPGTAGGATGLPGTDATFYVALDQGGGGAVHRLPEATSIPTGAGTVDVVAHPLGTSLYAANAAANTVSVINVAAGVVIATVPVGTRPAAIDVSPTGDRVLVVNADSNTVSFIATATNTVVRTIALPPGTVARGRFIGGLELSDQPGPLTGLWWNPDQSGWGLHLTQRNAVVFAAWFTYDAAGAPKWYVASACRFPPGANVVDIRDTLCEGSLYETTGPRFFRDAFDPAAVRPVVAGFVRIDFRDRHTGTLNYTVGGHSASVPIQRQVFRDAGVTPVTDYTDLWWNPRQSGWGLGVTQQFDVMFLTWFVYDDAGRPVWYVASNCAIVPRGNGCSGPLYRTAGPPGPASGQPFDPARVGVTEVGTVTLQFQDPNNGDLTYRVDGLSGVRTITRQTF